MDRCPLLMNGGTCRLQDEQGRLHQCDQSENACVQRLAGFLAEERARVKALEGAGDRMRGYVSEFIEMHASSAPQVTHEAAEARRAWDAAKNAE